MATLAERVPPFLPWLIGSSRWFCTALSCIVELPL
jgi:hypothetical protein